MRKGLCSPTLGAMAILVLALASCDDTEPTEQQDATGDSDTGVDASTAQAFEGSSPAPQSSGESASTVANPADEHCVKAGYRLDFIHKDGIPVDALCVNDKTGAQCESWAFFRGECALDAVLHEPNSPSPRNSEVNAGAGRHAGSAHKFDLGHTTDRALEVCAFFPKKIVYFGGFIHLNATPAVRYRSFVVVGSRR